MYHCKYHKKTHGGFKARVKSQLEDAIFTRYGDAKHNHPPEPEEQQLLRVVNACVDAAAVDRRRPRVVFDAVRRQNPGIPIGYGDAMQRRMQRSKRRRQPLIPKTVEEIAGFIQEYPEYRDAFQGGIFFRGLVKTSEGDALVFLSPTLLPQLSEASEIQADATFRTVPILFKQLFTLHITKGHLAFPFAYILMTRKSRVLYDAVLGKVIDIFDELFPDRHIAVDLVMSDYEAAIQGSMSTAFHGSECIGCFFHYAQAIWRRVQKYGLQFAYKNRAVIEKHVKEIIALAHLPGDKVLSGFQNIKAHFRDGIRLETPAIQTAIKKLNNYFLSYWIGEITPEVFSVFGLINRTNGWLNQRMGTSHLNPWDFLYFIKEAEDSKALDYLAECQDIRTTRRTPLSQRKRNDVISQNEKDFVDGVISMREFLKKSRNLTEPDLIRRNRTESPERPTMDPTRRRFLAGTIRAYADHVALPAEPVDAPPVKRVNVLATLVSEVTPAGRPRRVTQVPRHLSAEGDSPITPPNRRSRVQARGAH